MKTSEKIRETLRYRLRLMEFIISRWQRVRGDSECGFSGILRDFLI
jgi:hypothetical protein